MGADDTGEGNVLGHCEQQHYYHTFLSHTIYPSLLRITASLTKSLFSPTYTALTGNASKQQNKCSFTILNAKEK